MTRIRLPKTPAALALTLALAAAVAPVAPAAATPTLPATPTPTTPAATDAIPELDAIVVTGVVPGPGLWRVERDGHVLWILATVSPLPRRIEWNADEVEAKIAASGLVLLAPGARIEAEGMLFGGIFLLPSLMKARNNPDGARLADVLPPADYARWQALKARYLGRDRGIEKRRPLVASIELREAALERHGLSTRPIVENVVERAARRADVPTERPEVEIVVADARAAVKSFRASTLDDLDCFRRVLDQVEGDLDTLADRANAWSLGRIDDLQRLPTADAATACTDAVFGDRLARETGLSDLPERVAANWLADAEAAIAAHPQSFALLPLSRVTGPEAWLPRLAAKGYVVSAPAPADAAPTPDDATPVPPDGAASPVDR